MISVVTKNGRTKKITPPLLVLLLNPGSRMDKKSGSGISILDSQNYFVKWQARREDSQSCKYGIIMFVSLSLL
jgi:hypothetical protein